MVGETEKFVPLAEVPRRAPLVAAFHHAIEYPPVEVAFKLLGLPAQTEEGVAVTPVGAAIGIIETVILKQLVVLQFPSALIK